jgi:hypothetical protein
VSAPLQLSMPLASSQGSAAGGLSSPSGASGTFNPHKAENNAASQKHLDANRAKFSRACSTVYSRLMAGDRLTVRQCAIDGISSLPRRVLDLKEQGVAISDEWAGGVKVYFMSAADAVANRQAVAA